MGNSESRATKVSEKNNLCTQIKTIIDPYIKLARDQPV